MTHKTLRATAAGLALALLLPLAATAAGGSTSSAPAAPAADPRALAMDAYKRGLKARDKAWEYEEKAAAATGLDREKLMKKAGKEYEKAIRAQRSAIRHDPQLYQAHSSLGYALRKTGDYEASLAAYDTALELNSRYTEAIEYRAEAYLGLNRLDEAKEAYMELFRDDRERADELMEAMRSWVEERERDAAGLDVAVIEGFSGWVRERSQLAEQTGGTSGGAW